MPFRVPSARIAQASPSISLEKGSYRMRAPPTRTPVRPSRLRTSKSQARADGGPKSQLTFVPASHEKRMALLVVLLACTTMASFGVAYYLWTTRCVCRLRPTSTRAHTPRKQCQDLCRSPSSVTSPYPAPCSPASRCCVQISLLHCLLVSTTIVIRVPFVVVFVVG
ncbi:hypothetical protein V8D89_005216 [Ganoderma adspersum]